MLKSRVVSLLWTLIFCISFSTAHGKNYNEPDPVTEIEEETIITDIRNVLDRYSEAVVSIKRLPILGGDILRAFWVKAQNDEVFFVKISQSDDGSRYIDKFNELDKVVRDRGIKKKLKRLNATIVMPVHDKLHLTTVSSYEMLIFPFVPGRTLNEISRSKFSFLSYRKEIADAFFLYGQAMGIITHEPVARNDENEPLRLSTPDRHWGNVLYSEETQELFIIDLVNQDSPVLTSDSLTTIYKQLHWASLFKFSPYTNVQVALEAYQNGYKENLNPVYGLDVETIENYWIDRLNEKHDGPGMIEDFIDRIW